MLGDIFSRITATEIIYSVVMFVIIRFIIWCLRQAERVGETEVQRLIHGHIHSHHKGHWKTCTQCNDIVTIDEVTI